MRFLIFIFTQTLRNIRQAWTVQFMTLLTVMLSVLIFSFFYLIYMNMLQEADKLGDGLRITVYLKSPLSSEEQES